METQIVKRVKVNKSEGFEGGSFHEANTLLFSISGPHVFRFSHSLMASVLMGPCGIGRQGIKSIYHFEDPKRWYATLTAEAKAAHYERLHGMKHELHDPKLTIVIENIEKEKTKATIHWMPTTAKVETVKQIAAEISGDVNAEVHKLKNSTDKWLLLCNPKEPLPHYVDMEFDGVEEKLHRLFITIPGRRTVCTVCGEDTHWSNKCPTKGQTQKEFLVDNHWANKSPSRRLSKNTKETTLELSTEDFPALVEKNRNAVQDGAEAAGKMPTTRPVDRKNTQDGAEAAGKMPTTRPVDKKNTATTRQESEDDGIQTANNKRKQRSPGKKSPDSKDTKEGEEETSPEKPTKKTIRIQEDDNNSDTEGPLFVDTDPDTDENHEGNNHKKDTTEEATTEETNNKRQETKRQSPKSYFMDVKCPDCYKLTTLFSHSQTVVLCGGCAAVLCQPTGGEVMLTEGIHYRKHRH